MPLAFQIRKRQKAGDFTIVCKKYAGCDFNFARQQICPDKIISRPSGNMELTDR